MTRQELIMLHADFMRTLAANSVDPKDVRHVEMIKEYETLKAERLKSAYIICHLGEKYHLSERAIYQIVKRFSQKITI